MAGQGIWGAGVNGEGGVFVVVCGGGGGGGDAEAGKGMCIKCVCILDRNLVCMYACVSLQ